MMTDHNTTGRFVYCTDTILGTVGVINEALLYSDETCIELLPALPEIWKKGSIQGLMARCFTEVKNLSWDMIEKKVMVSLIASKDITIHVRCNLISAVDEKVQLSKGKLKDLVFCV